ncbi:MAG: histidine kinase [Rubritepida sp.]|nr:histidine kinase [Rubritepida sp.]
MRKPELTDGRSENGPRFEQIAAVVGIGAESLEDFLPLLTGLPTDKNLAFVLILQHHNLHPGLLAGLLADYSPISVVVAEEGAPLRPNHLHVAPPGSQPVLERGVLHFSATPAPQGSAFDCFLRSLAASETSRAVAILLSGAGPDNWPGLREIRERGGYVFAQSPAAGFDGEEVSGTPEGAIAAGLADRVLSATEIGEALASWCAERAAGESRVGIQSVAPEASWLKGAVASLARLTPLSLEGYKPSTLQGRIERRMRIAGAASPAAYLASLETDESEAQALADDLHVNMRGFFRDSEALLALRDKYLVPMLAASTPAQPLRIWVAACGTGEEAYTIAMLAADALAAVEGTIPPQIFASDIDPAAVAYARAGLYPRHLGRDIPREQLARYFVEENDGWRVTPRLRAMVVFGAQNPFKDPPFSRLGMIVCRDLLNHLLPNARAKLLALFHFALNSSGILCVNGTDSGRFIEQGFTAVSAVPRIYRRLNVPWPTAANPSEPDAASPPSGTRRSLLAPRSVAELARRAATDAFIPPSVLIDAAGRVLFAIGPLGRFLDLPAGEPTNRLLALLVPRLRRGAAHAITEARRSGQTVSFGIMPSYDGSAGDLVTLRVQPVQHEDDGLMLVSFVESPAAGSATPVELPDLGDRSRIADQEKENEALQHELESLRLELDFVQQQANLDGQEAMSAQEELIAARDDQASLNRELDGLNEQLRRALQDERQASGELRNILASSGVAMLLLDAELNIRFYTPSERLPFRIIGNDIGRPLAHIAPLAGDTSLLDEARAVLTTLQPSAREVLGPDGSWLMRRIQPCNDHERGLVGVVITYVDISEIKKATGHAEAVLGATADIVQSIRQPLIVLDANLQVVFANEAFGAMFGAHRELGGNALRVLVGPALRSVPKLASFLTSRDGTPETIEDSVVEVTLPARGRRTLRLAASRLRGGAPAVRTLLAVEDITDRVMLTSGLETAKAMAERASREKSRLLTTTGHDLRQPLQSIVMLQKIMAETVSDPQVLRDIGRLDSPIAVMSGILDALQDSEQLELGNVHPSFSAFRIGTLLATLEKEFGEHARARGLQWRMVPCERMIISDIRLLRQVLRNLISAVLRYTPKGRILLGCRRKGDLLRIEILIQLPLPQPRANFDDTRQAGHPLVERGEALGLGLEVARRLAELLGHPIRVEPRAMGQAIFAIDVPTSTPAAASLLVTPEKGSLRHILIIAEDLELGEMLRILLERDGYAATLATDAMRAMGLALENPPALVIADHDLSDGMTGLDVVRRIGQAQARPPAAILLTGEDIEASVLEGISGRSFDHLLKPIDPTDLLDRVHRWLPHARGARTAPAEGPRGHVFIVEDDAALRLATAEWLEGQGWATESFASARAFLDADTPTRRGCVLVDSAIVGMDGLALLNALRPNAHRLPAIMIAGRGDIRLAVSAVSAGAIDFIEKPIHGDALLRSLEKATALIADGARQQASKSEHAAKLANLTERQREILDRIIAGMPNKNIAADLNLSQRTVENHRAAIMSKLGARSLPELIRIVMTSV